jgi:hypothetical protein
MAKSSINGIQTAATLGIVLVWPYDPMSDLPKFRTDFDRVIFRFQGEADRQFSSNLEIQVYGPKFLADIPQKDKLITRWRKSESGMWIPAGPL